MLPTHPCKPPTVRIACTPLAAAPPAPAPTAPPVGPSAADQAELDGLLDKIGASGMDSLSGAEKKRLNELSKRLRNS